MAGKVSPAAAGKIAQIGELLKKLQKIHGLVEQYATAKAGQDAMCTPISRGFAAFKRDLMGAGLDSLSQTAGALGVAAGRGMGPNTKARILREGVGSLRFQLELEHRAILADDQAKAAEKAAAKGKA